MKTYEELVEAAIAILDELKDGGGLNRTIDGLRLRLELADRYWQLAESVAAKARSEVPQDLQQAMRVVLNDAVAEWNKQMARELRRL